MRRVLLQVSLVAVVLCLATAVFAQGGPPAGAPAAGGAAGGQGGPGGPGMMNPGMMQAMMERSQLAAPPVISVTDKFVFVVYGGTLFQFDVTSLQLVNKASLTPERTRGERGGQGGNRHGGGGAAGGAAAPGANATPPGAAGPAPANQ